MLLLLIIIIVVIIIIIIIIIIIYNILYTHGHRKFFHLNSYWMGYPPIVMTFVAKTNGKITQMYKELPIGKLTYS